MFDRHMRHKEGHSMFSKTDVCWLLFVYLGLPVIIGSIVGYLVGSGLLLKWLSPPTP